MLMTPAQEAMVEKFSGTPEGPPTVIACVVVSAALDDLASRGIDASKFKNLRGRWVRIAWAGDGDGGVWITPTGWAIDEETGDVYQLKDSDASD